MTDIYGTWYEYCALGEQHNARVCTPVLEPVVTWRTLEHARRVLH